MALAVSALTASPCAESSLFAHIVFWSRRTAYVCVVADVLPRRIVLKDLGVLVREVRGVAPVVHYD